MSPIDIKRCMTYLGCQWGFNQSARVSEYTCPEKGAVDHCIRVDDLTFVLRNSEAVVGSGLIGAGFGGVTEGCKRIQDILENQVFPLSCKGKTKTKAKLIRRRSVEEGMFLEDIVIFVTKVVPRE